MRIGISKNLKRAVIAFTSILIIVLSFLFYFKLTIPEFKEVKSPTYNWSSKGIINYEVFLKPNMLYATKSLQEGGVYITQFTDSIKTVFRYEFKGDRMAGIKADYYIAAVVEGYQDKKGDYAGEGAAGTESAGKNEAAVQVIWSKEYKLVPVSRVELKDKAAAITRAVTLKYEDYNSFAQKVIDASKLGLQTRITVTMNVILHADTDKGPVEDKASQSIAIPLGTNSFSIAKNELFEKPGMIEEVNKVRLPLNRRLIVTYTASVSILLILLASVVFLTRSKPGKSEYVKTLDRIFKKYGNRLAALNGVNSDDYSRCMIVRTIDDLIRISDEIQKPVLYRYDSEYNSISWFFVYDNERMYLFDLWEYMNKINKDQSNLKHTVKTPNPSVGTNTIS